MAKQTIHKLSYQLTLDAQGFTNGVERTKKELSAARRVMRQTITPLEKYENEQKKLQHLLKKGALTQEMYNRAVKRAGDQYTKTTKKASMFGRTLGKMSGRMKAGLAGLAASVSAGVFIRQIDQAIDRVDALGKAANKLGTSTDFLSRLQYAGGQAAGMDDAATRTGLEKLVNNISDAAQGKGESKTVLEELGLDANTLQNSGAEASLKAIAQAMEGVTNKGEKLRMATDLFGRSATGMVQVLDLGIDGLDEMFAKSDRLGNTVSQDMANDMAVAADSIDNMTRSFEGMWNQISVAAVPAIEKLATVFEHLGEVVSRTMQTAHGFMLFVQNFKQNPLQNPLTTMRDSMIQAAGAAQNRRASAAAAAIPAAAAKPAVQANLGMSNFISGLVEGVKNTKIPGSLAAGWNAGDTGRYTRTTSGVATQLSGPAASATAGSSAAFAAFNQTKSVEKTKIELQKKQVDYAEKTANAIGNMWSVMKAEGSEALGL